MLANIFRRFELLANLWANYADRYWYV